ncbi:MAG: PAS domain-containing protein, partial [Gammaproteobacteria bacterium]|nr:PAS domain-containing protein [Gammaproteobacteria bacterium]
MVTNFDSIIDKLPDVIYTANTVNNHSRRVNNAVFSLYGYTQQEWACQPDMWHACLHTDDRQRVLQVISAIKENSEGYVQYRIIRKDGSVRWLADHYNALASVEGNGLCVYGVMTDITEYKNQIEYSRQNLDELLEESATVIYRCEPSGNFPATFISNNVTRQMGYMPEDFITDSSFWMNHIHPDERDHVLGDLSKLFEHGYHSHEYRFLHANGAYVWM